MICDIRIMSILEDIENIKYMEKKKHLNYNIYIYSEKNVIYISKNIIDATIMKEIVLENSKNYNKISIYKSNDILIKSFIISELDATIKDNTVKKIKKIIIEK